MQCFRSVFQLLVTANIPSSLILFTLMMEEIRQFLQQPHVVITHKSHSSYSIMVCQEIENKVSIPSCPVS
jgi:hypothetical protein